MLDSETPGRLSDESLLGNDGRFLWYCIPKNASRTVSRILRRHGNRLGDLNRNNGLEEFLASIERPQFIFAFVRNPYERVASAWRNKVFDPPVTPGQRALFARSPGLHAGMGLSDFVRWLDERATARESPDPHWRPQYHYLCNRDLQLCVDYLGRLEIFDLDLAFLASELGVPLSPRHDNATPRHISAQFDDEAVDIIQRLYELDFDLLGYDRADFNLQERAPVAQPTRRSRRLAKVLTLPVPVDSTCSGNTGLG